MLKRLSSSFARGSILRFNSTQSAQVKSDNNLPSIDPQEDVSRVPITNKPYYLYTIKEKT